jgi:hypothetical protein
VEVLDYPLPDKVKDEVWKLIWIMELTQGSGWLTPEKKKLVAMLIYVQFCVNKHSE